MKRSNQLPSEKQRRSSNSTEFQDFVLNSQSSPQIHAVPTSSKTSSESHSSFIANDYSNSASPVRRQPNPSALKASRYTDNEDGRYLQWPPPEPRPQNQRTLLPPIGMFFGGPTRLLPDRNIWLFGHPTQIQQLVSENTPQIESSDVDVAIPQQDIETQRVNAEDTPDTDIILNGQSIPTFEMAEVGNTQAEMSEELGNNMEEFQAQENSVVSEDMHDAIGGERTNTEPPTGPIVFVIVDTNDGGLEDDEQIAEQFRFALMHLLTQLEIDSGEEGQQNDEQE
ncbi:unnamed protein product [Hymenolepis diminuta]|uniref:Uncharacterized protein n=1 Tax=Hymenolepis diminuta TaxID=6216 RepID=A0A0R3SUG0_HYMDI|nr:unnamed protein product [Hymenolepis diminuta]